MASGAFTTTEHAIADRKAIAEAYQSLHGAPASLAELQILQAMGNLESNGGRASYHLLDHATGQVIASSGVINNWGAVQTSEGPPNGFLATDTGPQHITDDNPKGYYDHYYKVYPTSAEGAKHMVEHLTTKRPYAWEAMKAGDIDEFVERAHARYLPGGGVKVDPITKMPGYFQQKPAERAHGLEIRIAEFSEMLGEPIAAKRGGPVVDVVTDASGSSPMSTPMRAGLIGVVLAVAAIAARFVWGSR